MDRREKISHSLRLGVGAPSPERSCRIFFRDPWEVQDSVTGTAPCPGTGWSILSLLMFSLAAGLFLTGAVRPLPANATWYVTLPQALSIPLLIWMLRNLALRLIPGKRAGTVHEKSVLSLGRAAEGASLCLALTALAAVRAGRSAPVAAAGATMLVAARFLTAALLIMGIAGGEKHRGRRTPAASEEELAPVAGI